MSDTPIAAEQLRSFVDRIENVENERAGLAEDLRSIYAEAKAFGYDVKILRKVIARRKKREHALREEEELIEIYEAALSGQGDLFRAADTADTADNAAAGDAETDAEYARNYARNYAEAVDPETGEVNPDGVTATVTISAERFGQMADAVKRAGGIRPARGRRAEKVDA